MFYFPTKTFFLRSSLIVIAPDGHAISLEEIALHSLHHANQEQIMAVGSFMSPVSPPPFAAQFAEVTVDIETGGVVVDHLVNEPGVAGPIAA